MKTFKRFAALLLSICLLLGIPMSVSAVGTATPENLELIGAQPYLYNTVLPGSAFSTTNGTWGDKGLCLYFNQKVTSFASGTSVIRMAVVDTSGAVVKIGSTTYAWKLTGHCETAYSDQVTGYMLALGTYGNGYSTAKTWTEIIAWLAARADAGYRLRVFIYENGTYTDNNGKVDSLTALNDSSIVLPANGHVGSAADRLGMSNRDYVTIDVGTVAAGATTITYANLLTINQAQMTNGTDMTINFSEENVTVDVARTDAVMQVVSANGTTVYDSYPVTLTATGTASLTENTWDDVDAVLGENEGSYARLKLTEKDVVGARDERFANQVLDVIWGTNTNHPLKASGERTGANTADFVYCEVAPVVVDSRPAVVSVEELSVAAGKVEMVVTFSEPITVNAPINAAGEKYWDIILRYNKFDNGTNQDAMRSYEYVNGVVGEDGKTYSDKIVVTFKPATLGTGTMGVMIGEYDHHDQGHGSDAMVSPEVIADVDGNGLKKTDVTTCKKANTACATQTSELVCVSYTFAKEFQTVLNEAAAAGQDVLKMEADVMIDGLLVPEGITLDLNGHKLTVDVVSAQGGVIDSKDGVGGVVIAKNDTEAQSHLLQLSVDNAALPLYDEVFGGYRFFNCTIEHKGREKDGDYQFGYILRMSDAAFALLVDADGDGVIDADMALNYDITIQVDDKEPVQLLRKFSANTLVEYGEKQLLDDGLTYAATLRITGFEQVTTQVVTVASVNPHILSSTGVVIAASDTEVTYTYSNAQ